MKKKIEKKDPLLKIRNTYEDFIRLAENATNRHLSLKARVKSVELRKLLKEYRENSLVIDKEISEKVQKLKEEEKKIRGI